MKMKIIPNELVGIIPNDGNSIKQIKDIRKALSEEKFNLDEINKLQY